MKLILAYDGSNHSEAAIDDLPRCGLPYTGEAVVISVAEVWLPPPDSVNGNGGSAASVYIQDVAHEYRKKGERAVSEAQMLAKFAERRLRVMLPEWNIRSEATYGSPGWEILDAADRLKADLVIVGSQGRSALGRLVLGSISQKVMTEAACSVLLARGKVDVDAAGGERIVIGFDGSPGAHRAVRAVASRNWGLGCEVRLISVSESLVPTTVGRFVPPIAAAVHEINIAEREWVERDADAAIAVLNEAGIGATLRICPGNPKNVLPEEAARWGADCIFVGANYRGSVPGGFLIGSTAAAVAARASCSVELVRERDAARQVEPDLPAGKGNGHGA